MCWNSITDTRTGAKELKYKTDKEQALKDNIQIRFNGFGWEEARATGSNDGKKKSITMLQVALICIISKSKRWKVPNKPPPRVPQRKVMPIVGTLSDKVWRLDEAADATSVQIDIDCKVKWRHMDGEGEMSTLERLQGLGKWKLDDSYVGKRIEYLSNFDIDKAGTTKEPMWCT